MKVEKVAEVAGRVGYAGLLGSGAAALTLVLINTGVAATALWVGAVEATHKAFERWVPASHSNTRALAIQGSLAAVYAAIEDPKIKRILDDPEKLRRVALEADREVLCKK